MPPPPQGQNAVIFFFCVHVCFCTRAHLLSIWHSIGQRTEVLIFLCLAEAVRCWTRIRSKSGWIMLVLSSALCVLCVCVSDLYVSLDFSFLSQGSRPSCTPLLHLMRSTEWGDVISHSVFYTGWHGDTPTSPFLPRSAEFHLLSPPSIRELQIRFKSGPRLGPPGRRNHACLWLRQYGCSSSSITGERHTGDWST